MSAATVLTPSQVRSIERTLSGGTWTITLGAVLYSVLTVTPLVQRVTPDRWDWTAPILPLVVDAAVVIVIRLDAVVSRLGESGGRWSAVLRWMTGLMTLGLNTADSALKHDPVGVAVHAVAPLLLIVTAEATLAYRRAIARAHDRAEAEQAAERERERAERERERAARERAEREARERAREEREHAARLEREREERAAAARREEREHAARLEREREERAAAARREEREHAAQLERERLERERAEREARERAEREERERLERERAEREARERAEREEREREATRRREQQAARRRERPAVHGAASGPVRERRAEPAVNADRMAEEDARRVVVNTPDASVRQLSDVTGWSIGWISKVRREAA